ncbi:hypothetical protein M9Y10_040225 [Tritrichomonas musculus]|uniref:RING-type domain-containing protein n=1 Tax=Tritrichomonas musculus TaxID=1915356 RepID=A0ABR2GQ03_9EUKA
MKCLICDHDANQKAKNKNIRLFCEICTNGFEMKRSKSILIINEKIRNIGKHLSNISEILKGLPQNKSTSDSEPLSYQTSSPVFTPPISNLRPTPVSKSSFKFKGKVRCLNQNEKQSSRELICPYCKLTIDKELYLYPLVILGCHDGYYHRECFAKLMASGKTKCLACNKSFFQLNSNDDDDDDDEGDYF